MLASTALEEALLALKIAFLVLLYLFIWRIVRTVGRDARRSQESFVLRPAAQPDSVPVPAPQAQEPPPQPTGPPRLVVERSPVLRPGSELELDSTSFTVGRSFENDVSIDGDEFASARHLRVEPRRDGVWVQDLGSTNGTYVNGERIEEPRRLERGDVVAVGATELRYEE
ncbi:MAG TPA: FHA domain-containing protein [Gaiellaceae bacterium]|nr:FHA domain-containing protein [Gaiellaceae bacterium]